MSNMIGRLVFFAVASVFTLGVGYGLAAAGVDFLRNAAANEGGGAWFFLPIGLLMLGSCLLPLSLWAYMLWSLLIKREHWGGL